MAIAANGANGSQPFTRLPVPTGYEDLSFLIHDIYDKLNAVALKSGKTEQTVQTVQTVINRQIVTTLPSAAGGGTSPAPSPSPTPAPTPTTPTLTDVPLLQLLPSDNPGTGAPYAQDGVLVEVSAAGSFSVPGRLYRYNGTIFAWQPTYTLAVLLEDTLANWTTANYPPGNYPVGTPFLNTTWQVVYESDGTNWNYLAGAYVAVAASRPTTGFNGAALGTHDKGLLFIASDTIVLQYWDGAAWQALGGAVLAKYSTSWVAQTSVTVNHNLGTTDVIVQVYETSTGLQQIVPTTIVDANNVSLAFGAAFTGFAVVIG